VEENLPLARWYVARCLRARPGHHDRDELLSAVYPGLIRAAQVWDPTRGSFSMVALIWMRSALQKWLALERRFTTFGMMADEEGRTPDVEDSAPGPDRLAEAAEGVARVEASVPPRVFRLLQMRYVLRMKLREIGARLGVTPEAVRMRLLRAHRLARRGPRSAQAALPPETARERRLLEAAARLAAVPAGELLKSEPLRRLLGLNSAVVLGQWLRKGKLPLPALEHPRQWRAGDVRARLLAEAARP
jgi:RNA polymerase sigma factor (sigma-70 family)